MLKGFWNPILDFAQEIGPPEVPKHPSLVQSGKSPAMRAQPRIGPDLLKQIESHENARKLDRGHRQSELRIPEEGRVRES